MASTNSQSLQRKSPSGWTTYLPAKDFQESQHESSMKDQHDQFRVRNVDPEPEHPVSRNVSSVSVKVESDVKSELGKGTFAKVYVGRLVGSGKQCAVKVFNDKVLADDVEKQFKWMHDLKHPNIVCVYGMIPDYKIEGRNAFAIAMELCDMSLDQYIKERFKNGISKVKFLQILHDIASAMVYLHSQDMVHGDLRSRKVLVKDVDDRISAKITFGMVGCLNEAGELMTTMFADAKYLPPEMFVTSSKSSTSSKEIRGKYLRKVDVFSYGPIAIELGCGEFPEPTAKAFTKRGIVKTCTEIERREKHIKKVKKAHSECIELIVEQCMQDRPEERASFSEILLTVEGFQTKSKKQPDSEWIEEKQKARKQSKELESVQFKITELEKMNSLLANERDQLVTERDELNLKLHKLEAKNDQLHSEQMSLTTGKDSLQVKYSKLEIERDRLKTEKDELNSRLTKLKAEKVQFQSEQKSLAIGKDSLQGKFDKLEIERDRLKNERGHLQSEIGNLKKELGRVEGEKGTLYEAHKALEVKIIQLEKSVQGLKVGRDVLETERDNLKTERDDLKTERDALEADRNMIRIEKKQLESENRKTIQTMKAEKGQLKKEADNLKTQLRSKEQGACGLNQQLATEKTRADAAERTCRQLQGEVKELTDKNATLTQSEGSLNARLESMKKNCDELQKEITTLKYKGNQLDKNVKQLNQELSLTKEVSAKKTEQFEEERERWEADVALLKEKNATLHEALDLDRQANLLMKVHESIERVDKRISEDVQSGVKSVSEDVRKMTDQLPDTESKIDILQNEKISLKLKLATKEEEVKQLTKKFEDVVKTVQSKKKEEEELLIDRVREEMKEQQMSMLKEQQLSMMKELLAELKGPSQDVLPPSDTVKGEEDDVEKEKLRAQVEDLQKQLKEKTIVKQAEGDDTADKEMLQKQVEHLQKKLDEKEKDLTAVSQVEQTLRDTLSAERGRVEELQNETAGMKLQTQDLSQQLSQSKECIKALENILNNLVLRDKMADKVSNDVGNVCEAEDLGALAHEAELEKLCWIPFGIQTLTVGEEGGLFPLQPQTTEVYKDNDVIALEVPEGAVNTAVCDRLCIQYGVIVYGPFDLPEGYQLCSMAVYIYFNQDHAVKPVVLHLPHWSGKDGESGLKCIVAPHRLEEGEENYKFKDVEEGDFQSTEGCCLITIDGHCSLFAVALKKETSLKYYATGHERYDEKGTHLDVVITYASQVWLEILQKYRCPVSCSVLFEFAHSQIEGSVRPASGPGWTSWRDKNHVVQQEDIQFKSHGITSPKHLEGAVKRKAYPPFISCRTTYSKKLRKKGQPTHAVLLIEGAKDKPMEFLCSAYGYTLADNISVPVGSGYTVNISDSAYSSLSTASTNTRTINVAKAVNLRLASHEAELEKLCWIPFGIQTLTVGEEGGLFPLQPQTTEAYEDNDVIALEVPEGAINTAVCDRLCIRYGVIIHGPFDLPEGYQPVSVAVYIYFNQDHAVKPVVLHLPHWSRKDGESGLKGVVAPHRLEEGEEKYKFKVVEEGDFQSREGRGIISVHSACTLFTLIFKKDAKSKYYATPVEKTGKEGSNLQVIFTYFSEVWLKLLDEYHSPGLYSVPFEFSSGKIQGHLEATQGRGWRAHIVGSGVTTEEQCLYEYSGYENGRDLEAAVQRGIYPPMIVCRTEYGHALQKTGNPTKAGLVLKGIQKGILRFLLTTYEYTSQERHIPIGTETVSMVTPPRRNVQMSIAQALPPKKTINPSKELSMQKLMPYIPDLAPCGQEIARYLGLSTVWASIEISLKDPPGRLQELLTKWLDDSEQKTSPHTWEFFVDVVRKVGKGKLADRIAEEIL